MDKWHYKEKNEMNMKNYTYLLKATATDSVLFTFVIKAYKSCGLSDVASVPGNSSNFVIKSFAEAFGSELALSMSNS